MIVAAGVLLALALLPGTDEDVVRRAHVRFAGVALTGASCSEVIGSAPEPGYANIGLEFRLTGARRVGPGRYAGTVAFTLGEVVVTVPASIAWSHMNAADRARAEALRAAIAHHEIGHVRIAEAVRDALNDRGTVEAADPFALRAAADAVGRDGFAAFTRQQRAYDELTDHGRKQHAAPGALAGSDTTIRCS